MTEHTANFALDAYAAKYADERAKWVGVLGPATKAKKLAPVTPRVVKAQQKKISLFRRIFSV